MTAITQQLRAYPRSVCSPACCSPLRTLFCGLTPACWGRPSRLSCRVRRSGVTEQVSLGMRRCCCLLFWGLVIRTMPICPLFADCLWLQLGVTSLHVCPVPTGLAGNGQASRLQCCCCLSDWLAGIALLCSRASYVAFLLCHDCLLLFRLLMQWRLSCMRLSSPSWHRVLRMAQAVVKPQSHQLCVLRFSLRPCPCTSYRRCQAAFPLHCNYMQACTIFFGGCACDTAVAGKNHIHASLICYRRSA